ncbi:MAG TPA: anti-phage ZorAB system protein ZorA [Desulfomonilia bacterium]|nr:anti-phage ZorAB system protein ZorA [Desulfomonilia bacterium]
MGAIFEVLRHFPIIATISAILFAIAVNFLVRFVRPALNIRKDLRAAVGRLGQIKTSPEVPAGDLDEISRSMLFNAPLTNSWREYRETLHEQRIPDPSGSCRSVRWRSTTLAETFFTEQALVDTPLKTEFYKHLPGILTGLGIIGTFSGLITGLIRFEVSGDVERVRASLNGLIQSVGYSFVVSAMAITLSMIFIWVEKSLVTSCYRQVESLCRLIDSLFDAGVGEDYLARLVASTETSAEQTQKMNDSLVGDIRHVFTTLIKEQMRASAMLNKQLLAGVAQDISEGIRVPMERIELMLNGKRVDPGEAVDGALSDAIALFSERIEDVFGNRFREMGSILQKTGEAVESAALQMNRCVKTMQEAGRGTEEAMAERMTRTFGLLDERQKIMDRSMGEFVAQTSLVSGSQSEAVHTIQSTLGNVSERMAAMVERIEAGSRHASEEFEARQGRLTEQTISVISEINNQFKTLVGQMRQAGEAASQSTASLALMTKESSDIFTAGRDALQSSFSDFTKASHAVSATLQAVQKASDGIQSIATSLVQATNGVKGMLDEHRHTSEIFASIVSELRSTIENARHEASMTSEIIARIQNAAGQLGLAQNKADEYLHGLTDVLAQAHAEFAGNIELTLRKSNMQFHEELSKAVSLVSGAIQDFGDILDAVSVKDKKQCWV